MFFIFLFLFLFFFKIFNFAMDKCFFDFQNSPWTISPQTDVRRMGESTSVSEKSAELESLNSRWCKSRAFPVFQFLSIRRRFPRRRRRLRSQNPGGRLRRCRRRRRRRFFRRRCCRRGETSVISGEEEMKLSLPEMEGRRG